MAKKSTSTAKNIVIIGLVIVVAILIYMRTKKTPTETAQVAPTPAPVAAAKPITITEKNIKEENWSGSEPVISGDGELAQAARAYIEDRVSEFRAQANNDVPDMRAKFGADSPPASYTLDLKATYKKNGKTDSIIIDDYGYTGGANGSSSYKVFTVSHATGKILSLADVIQADKQSDFTALVKKRLMDWRPQGSTDIVVFEDAVNDLGFSSFTDWSMDGKNITIYFDKYEIGPGVLGAVPFDIPLSALGNHLNASFK